MQHAFPHYGVMPTSAGLQIIDRIRNGREAAKAQGVRFGRRPTLTPGQVEHARELPSKGRTAAEVAELLGVQRATLYRALRGQETSQAEAPRRSAFIEDALVEADALTPPTKRTRRHEKWTLSPASAPAGAASRAR